MIKIPSKSLIPILSILISSIVLGYLLIQPMLNRLEYYVDYYAAALNETTPIIHVKEGYIEFEGHIPQQITLADGAKIFFDTTMNDSLLEASPARSVFISETEMKIKGKNDLKAFSFENIKSDDNDVLEPLKLKEKIYHYRNKIFTALTIANVFITILFLFLLINFAAGIGIMVDAFMNGPHTFKQTLNIAGILLLLFTLVGIIFQLGSFQYIKYMILSYLVLSGVLVYVNTKLIINQKR